GQLEMMHFGSAATGNQAGVAKADAAFIRTLSGAPSSSLNIGSGSAAPLNLFTTDVVRMTVEAGGDVGIGLTNPSEKLEVAGTVRASAFVQSSDKRLKQ
ncbi:hypothetical protein GW777_06715, partial [Candidatus Peregrinibacteria bacterium]|nr:hypothetical protein [Candidatus Peregrinibacteria bacterium]